MYKKSEKHFDNFGGQRRINQFKREINDRKMTYLVCCKIKFCDSIAELTFTNHLKNIFLKNMKIM